MKWWAQSFLVGIPKIVCGFRDNEGIVQHIQQFKTVDIPRESQVKELQAVIDWMAWMWPSYCIGIDFFLSF